MEGFILQAHDVRRGRAIGQQALGQEFLAAQADYHGLAAEIGVAGEIGQRADGDGGIGGVDRHAAAIGVGEADDAIDIGVAGQQFAAHALQGEV